MELMEILKTRRSIRKYTGEAVPEEALKRILDAGLLAPSGQNKKPCDFWVVTDREMLTALSKAKKAGAGMLADCACAIVVTADSEKSDTWIEDSSVALTCMHLMAAEQEIASCWCQLHLRKDAGDRDAEDVARELLGLPSSSRIVGVLALGISARNAAARELDEDEYKRVHRI